MAGNPLFNMLGNNPSPFPPNVQNFLSRFQMFRQAFKGDPRQQVQQMLNSVQITQDQYNQAVQMANELQKYIN